MTSPSPPAPPPETDLSPEQLRARALALLPPPAARALEKEEQLGPVLHARLEASAQARTRFEVTDDDFLEALLRQVPPAGDALGTLRSIHAADLVLALGCAAGHPVALAEFDQRQYREAFQRAFRTALDTLRAPHHHGTLADTRTNAAAARDPAGTAITPEGGGRGAE
jgi:hypothetical protein